MDSPVCLPLRLASLRRDTRARECTTVGFLIIRPSLCSLATFLRELAREISLISLGSNQILRSPHLSTEAARRFCKRRETEKEKGQSRNYMYVTMQINRTQKHAPHAGPPMRATHGQVARSDHNTLLGTQNLFMMW